MKSSNEKSIKKKAVLRNQPTAGRSAASPRKRIKIILFSLLVLSLTGFGAWSWRDAIGRQEKTEYVMRFRIEILNLQDELKERFQLKGREECQAIEEILMNFNRRIVKMLE